MKIVLYVIISQPVAFYGVYAFFPLPLLLLRFFVPFLWLRCFDVVDADRMCDEGDANERTRSANTHSLTHKNYFPHINLMGI